jgi:hypothetical protein
MTPRGSVGSGGEAGSDGDVSASHQVMEGIELRDFELFERESWKAGKI